MIDWDKLNYIEYLDYQFTQDDIKSGSLLLNRDLTCASLAIDTLSPVVECDDTGILDFERDTPLYYYRAGRLRGVYYVQDIERVGPVRYQITAQSAIALLDRGRHMGGIYTGQEAGEVLSDIAGSVPITVKTNVAKQQLYGWLPIASPRANLAQALFALGASIRTGMDGALHVAFLWDGLSGVIPPDDTYLQGGAVRAQGKVTQVAVTEHQYIEGGDVTVLFEGIAQQGDEITFDEPMYDLQATGFSILDQGANYAVLSAGSGTLTGREYIHNTRLVTRSLREAQDLNVKTFPDATLVSLVNSSAVADRLANYYKHRQTVEESVIYTGQNCGDLLQLPDPFDAIQTEACLESAEISLSTTLKAQLKAIKEFVPLKVEEIEYFDAQLVVDEDGPISLPEGVTHVRAVLIGGGQGGSAGYDSGAGTSGTYASMSSPSTGSKDGNPGVGGEGGEPGTPGQGGNILIADLDLEPGDVLIAHLGTGGQGGAENGQAGQMGTNTTLTIGTQTFSSADGSPSNAGYTDVTTGNVYATPGQPGKKGANGGQGATSGQAAQPGGDVGSASGGAIGSNEYSSREVSGLGSPAVRQDPFTSYSDLGRVSRSGHTSYSIDSSTGIVTGTGTYKSISPAADYAGAKVYYISNGTQSISKPSVTSNIREYEVYEGFYGDSLRYRDMIIHRDYPVYRVTIVGGTWSCGGGGAAFGKSGFAASGTTGGNGADAIAPADAQQPGAGGDAGHGGGGPGGGGAGFVSVSGTSGTLSYSAYGPGGSPGVKGKGSKGAKGARGVLILYFGVPQKVVSGPIVASNRRIILDRLGRRIIV